MKTPLSERFERSAGGQLVATIVVIIVLVATVGTHLPDSAVEDSFGSTAGRVARILGSEQAWGVFAPNPRASSIDMHAVVTFADGTTETWTLPEGPRIGGNLRYYRWRKWLERARSDDHRRLWAPTARWIASLYDDRDSPVTRVDLVRRVRENEVDGPAEDWREDTYLSLSIEEEER